MTVSLHDRLVGRPAKAVGLVKFSIMSANTTASGSVPERKLRIIGAGHIHQKIPDVAKLLLRRSPLGDCQVTATSFRLLSKTTRRIAALPVGRPNRRKRARLQDASTYSANSSAGFHCSDRKWPSHQSADVVAVHVLTERSYMQPRSRHENIHCYKACHFYLGRADSARLL